MVLIENRFNDGEECRVYTPDMKLKKIIPHKPRDFKGLVTEEDLNDAIDEYSNDGSHDYC